MTHRWPSMTRCEYHITGFCHFKALRYVMQEAVAAIRRHKRAQTMLDGSQPVPVQPVTQPNTPVKRSLWGSRAAPPPEEPAGPSPYADCDPFDVTMMRCAAAPLNDICHPGNTGKAELPLANCSPIN